MMQASEELVVHYFEKLPENLWENTVLRRIFISFVPIHSVPPTVGLLDNLKVLSLYNCSLLTLPKELGEMVALEILTLQENQLTALPCLEKLVNLECLNVSGNRLREIGPDIGKLPKLVFLFLDNNRLRSLPTLYNPKLGTLDLRRNRLTRLSVVGLNLCKLDISWNSISKVPKGLLQMHMRSFAFFQTPLASDPIICASLQFCAYAVYPGSRSSDQQYLGTVDTLL